MLICTDGLKQQARDVTEFIRKLLEHFEEHLIAIAEVFNLPYVFNIHSSSRVFCPKSNEEYLSLLTLPLPLYHNEEAADCLSQAINIYSLMDSCFKVENFGEHTCPQRRFV